MNSDPISDMLARIRNALAVRHHYVLVPSSRIKVAIARIMEQEGYIQSYEITQDKPQSMLKIWLKYTPDRQSALSGLRRVSKPGQRIYAKASEIPRVLSGMGVAILSTPRGVLTDQQARRLRVGGEIICYVW